MKRLRIFIIFNVFVIMLSTSPAWAGSQQGGEPQIPIDDIATFTKKIERTMAEKGVRVFIIGRNGSPIEELPKGVEFTHVAFGVYSKVETQDGRVVPGYAYYNLYQSEENGATSSLVTDYTIDFLVNIYEPKVGIVIPTPELQKRLLSFIGTPEYQSLHNPNYSVLSNPYNDIFQNCTEFTLDVINSSIYQTVDKNQLKVAAKDHFKAYDVHISPFKVLFGSMFVSGVTKSDHDGQIKTATFTTIAKYLENFNLAQEVLTIDL